MPRAIHLQTLLILALCLPRTMAGDGPPAVRPNFVFFLVDDLGWADIGINGSTFYDTPNIDRLARGGMNFTRGYAACPVCSPTRASILTGRYPARMDTTDWFGGNRAEKILPAPYIDRLPLENVTIAEALREAGYRTAFVGKWHLGGEGYYPEDQGFQLNVGGHERGSPPGGYFSPYKNPRLTDGPPGEHLTARLTDEAISFVREAAGEPFLLYMSYYSVHTPLQGREDLKRKYRERRDALPAAPEDKKWGRVGRRDVRLVQDHPVYAAMMEAMDESVGRLLALLEEL